MDRDDVGVAELLEDLQGDLSPQRGIERFVDDGHAAAGDLAQDLVLADAGPRGPFGRLPEEPLDPVQRIDGHRERMKRSSSSTLSPGKR